jgi:multicomponent K+:H+ antiporter subunit A
MNPLSLAVLLPLLAGTLGCAWLGRAPTPGRRRLTAWWAAGVAAAALALLLAHAPAVFAGHTLLWQTEWLPMIGLKLGWRLDGLSLMFGLLVTGVGLLVILYAAYYLEADEPVGRFYALLMAFMAAMLGLVLADNLLLLVVWWELTSLISFLLVGYWGASPRGGAEARTGARMALAVTGGGGLALLAGIVLLGQLAGSYDLSVLLDNGETVRGHALYPLALALVLLGCFTKSAQWPFHFWLPDAMAAPTPVSAYLHSATLVKAGIFLLMRLYPVLGGTALFEWIVAPVGLGTMAYAAYVAVFRHDLKGLLAYSTISHLGLIVFLIGLDTPLAEVAAVFHVLNHATFKAALFMTAGIIDHETGTRDMRRLAGLMKYLPWTATLAMVAAAAMAGVPLANGFLSKEMFFAEAVAGHDHFVFGGLVPLLATFGGVCSVAYSLRFIHDVFFNGPSDRLPKPQPHEPPLFMKAPVALLVAICVAVGVAPTQTFGPMVRLAATVMLGHAPPPYQLALWHGLNLPLLMSGVALAGGVAFYFALQHRFDLHLHHPRGLTGRLVYSHALDGLLAFARRLIAALDNGALQRQLALLLGAALVAGALPFVQAGADLPGTGARARLPGDALSLLLWGLLLATGAALLRGQHHRLRAVVLVGVIGLIVALAFAALSAPDLALTQLAVEVVSTVLLLMGLALLPARSPRESGAARRWRDGLLAAAGGLGMAGLSWLMLTRDPESIADYFLAQSLPGGGGRNVVNVILVDFRGYDTFGEITVLAVAALGALVLLDGWQVQRPGADAQGRRWRFAQPPLLLRSAARLVLPLALMLSVYLFWRGHDRPGGGFIAGLVTAAALVLQSMALGQARAEALLRAAGGRRFVRWIAAGLALAGLTGAGAFAFGRPFLTSAFGHPVLPLLGELPLASAALFDLGVYVTVVGATLLTLSVLSSAGQVGARATPNGGGG